MGESELAGLPPAEGCGFLQRHQELSVGQRTFPRGGLTWELVEVERTVKFADGCTHTVKDASRAPPAMPRTWALPRAEDVSLPY